MGLSCYKYLNITYNWYYMFTDNKQTDYKVIAAYRGALCRGEPGAASVWLNRDCNTIHYNKLMSLYNGVMSIMNLYNVVLR